MQYVIIFPKVANSFPGNEILLIEKNRPNWQKGKLNLLGGKIEDDESPENAALRELKEEAGLSPLKISPTIMGRVIGSWGIVYCIKVPILFGQDISQREEETEKVSWYNWNEVKKDNRLLPNLKIIVPLMMLGITDWVISDEGPIKSGDNLEGRFMLTI